MNITIRQKYILSVSVFDPRIQFEKEKLSVSESAVSVHFRSVFIITGKGTTDTAAVAKFLPASPSSWS
jgi:hypothetical protein